MWVHGVPREGKAQRSPTVQMMLQSLVVWWGFAWSPRDIPTEGIDPCQVRSGSAYTPNTTGDPGDLIYYHSPVSLVPLILSSFPSPGGTIRSKPASCRHSVLCTSVMLHHGRVLLPSLRFAFQTVRLNFCWMWCFSFKTGGKKRQQNETWWQPNVGGMSLCSECPSPWQDLGREAAFDRFLQTPRAWLQPPPPGSDLLPPHHTLSQVIRFHFFSGYRE